MLLGCMPISFGEANNNGGGGGGCGFHFAMTLMFIKKSAKIIVSRK